MSRKLVSVIIPVYGAEDFVAKTIKSVLKQTYKELEVIIVDDGTKPDDKSIEICRQFDDPRITIIQQANRGLAGARNTGIRNSTGDYIALVDADDLWTQDKIEKHVNHLEKSPELGISFSYSELIDENDNSLGLKQVPTKIKDITPIYVLRRNPIGNGSAPVFRREVFKDIEFQDSRHGTEESFYFNEDFKRAEDVECWLRIAVETKWKCEGIPELLTLYRVNPGGLSASVISQYDYLEKIINLYHEKYPEIFSVDVVSLAKAYFQRYIARRSVSMRDGKLAVEWLHKSLKTDLGILFEEPRKTIVTALAAYFLHFVPSFYILLEQTAMNVAKARLKASKFFKRFFFESKSLTT